MRFIDGFEVELFWRDACVKAYESVAGVRGEGCGAAGRGGDSTLSDRSDRASTPCSKRSTHVLDSFALSPPRPSLRVFLWMRFG